MMKVAFLILAHEKPAMLRRFAGRLAGHGDIFVHIDAKADAACFHGLPATAHVLERRLAARWGGASLLAVAMRLLQTAMKRGTYDYYSLHSGVDYPIRPLEDFLAFLGQNRGREFLTAVPMSGPMRHQVERIYLTDFYDPEDQSPRAALYKELEDELARLAPRPMYGGWQPHTGSQWFTVTHALAEAALSLWKNDESLRAFSRFSFCPDEWFFPSFAVANGYGKARTPHGNLRYVDWAQKAGRGSPAWLTTKHYSRIIQSGAYFARKLDSTENGTPCLADLLDQYAGVQPK